MCSRRLHPLPTEHARSWGAASTARGKPRGGDLCPGPVHREAAAQRADHQDGIPGHPLHQVTGRPREAVAQAVPLWAGAEHVWAPRVRGPVWLHEHHSGVPPGTLTHPHLELAAGSKGREGPPSPVPCSGPCGAVWAGAGLCSVPVIPWRLVPAWAGCARWARAMQMSRAALTQRAVQCRASAWRWTAGRGPVDV